MATFNSVYIVRESPSEEPIAVFKDLHDLYRFSTTRCMDTCREAYGTVKHFFVMEEELQTNVRVTIWYDVKTGMTHSVAKYNVIH